MLLMLTCYMYNARATKHTIWTSSVYEHDSVCRVCQNTRLCSITHHLHGHWCVIQHACFNSALLLNSAAAGSLQLLHLIGTVAMQQLQFNSAAAASLQLLQLIAAIAMQPL